jgi:hypothetical protein
MKTMTPQEIMDDANARLEFVASTARFKPSQQIESGMPALMLVDSTDGQVIGNVPARMLGTVLMTDEFHALVKALTVSYLLGEKKGKEQAAA